MITFEDTHKIFISDIINDEKIVAGFGTKQVGDGREQKNSIALLRRLDVLADTLIIAEQKHGVNIVEYKRHMPRKVDPELEKIKDVVHLPDCDGVVTKDAGVVLSVITADCVPIVFVEKTAGIIGISHQGWKGTLESLPRLMIEKMVAMGANKAEIRCAIGPAIGDSCYKVDGERLEMFKKRFKGDEVLIFREDDEGMFLNLVEANILTLEDAGIDEKHIDYFDFCTSCDADLFYSYKRDEGIKGEMVNFVVRV